MEEKHSYLHAGTFLFSSLCVAARCTAGDRDTDARVLNENDSRRISILPALAVPPILRTVHHQLTPITDSKADPQR